MKKLLIPFVSIIIIVVASVIIFSPPKVVENKEAPSEKKNDKKEESWIEQLKNKYDYVIKDYEERYQKYQQENPDLTEEQVITYVNMGLDYEFYTNTKQTDFLNDNKILVNKYYYAGDNYIPDNLEPLDSRYAKSGIKLVRKAKEALEELIAAAKEQGYNIRVISAYRSYDYQNTLYQNYVNQDGKEAADTYSARPGYSEHQTGLVVDVDNYKLPYTSFEQTEEYQWMQENASTYGFILRFPKGKEHLTGYQFESWHYRYVGKDLAKKIKASGLTFEEYYARYLDKALDG